MPKCPKCGQHSKILIKIDRHEARKTGTYTRWVMPPDSEKVGSTYSEGKTHWTEFWFVPRESVLIRVRTSNRGNVIRTRYRPEELQTSQETEEV